MASTGVIPVEAFLYAYRQLNSFNPTLMGLYTIKTAQHRIKSAMPLSVVKLLSESAADSYVKLYRTSAAFNSDFNRKS